MRIIQQFRRPLILTFGLIVFLSGIVITLAVGTVILAAILAIWPMLGDSGWLR
jgi:hypothetical protein